MTEQAHCSFCGQSRPDVRFLMQGPEAAICGDCIVIAVRMLADGDLGRTIDHEALLPGEIALEKPR